MSDVHATTVQVTRRRMLGLVALSALGAACPPLLSACGGDGDPAGDAQPFWRAVAAEARRMDPTLDEDVAADELDRTLPPIGDPTLRQPSTALLEAVRRQTIDDFGSDRTLVVTGWVLARTEVLLAVIADGAA